MGHAKANSRNARVDAGHSRSGLLGSAERGTKEPGGDGRLAAGLQLVGSDADDAAELQARLERRKAILKQTLDAYSAYLASAEVQARRQRQAEREAEARRSYKPLGRRGNINLEAARQLGTLRTYRGRMA